MAEEEGEEQTQNLHEVKQAAKGVPSPDAWAQKPEFNIFSYAKYFCSRSNKSEKQFKTTIEVSPKIRVFNKNRKGEIDLNVSRIEVIAESPDLTRSGVLRMNLATGIVPEMQYRCLVGDCDYTDRKKLQIAYFHLVDKIQNSYNKNKILVIKNLQLTKS